MNPMLTPAQSALSLAPSDYLEFEKPLLRIQQDIAALEREKAGANRDLGPDIKRQRARYRQQLKKMYAALTPWETVLVARHPTRPLLPDYIRMTFRDFCELHGDRLYSDDKAIMSGFARVGGHKVMVIGHNKGREIKERVACHFGCAHPEGYRKALEKMKLAEKFGLPVVCLIDTQGAYPGVGAEERGIARAIAVNLMEMARLQTPVVCAVIGEGGSGGALGIGVGDRVAMFQHSFYSVISPEGCAAILWKTADRRKDAAEALSLTGDALLKLKIVDELIPEPLGGAHRDPEAAAHSLTKYLDETLTSLKRHDLATLVDRRYDRVRNWGSFFTETPPAPPEPAAEEEKPATSNGRKIASPKKSKPRGTAAPKRRTHTDEPTRVEGITA